ncbi:hypothetical protein THASP1DRAFT_27987 [Thamnocephalis sphaerospora]|uniref:Uncharacterized protein n=1 Tax=Thamnocephalis sphaerospora TaxID=78915 RepID=A0A4P9XX24_9FUNG|nr:hypothetical protein THASP1DRAFT_27987 [Thamnocephalis sphaerospora]|eukprot:RKP10221.1 hypothetical protein THASP1DRAFT_27987 [Thamnocephalis sphaerospora]
MPTALWPPTTDQEGYPTNWTVAPREPHDLLDECARRLFASIDRRRSTRSLCRLDADPSAPADRRHRLTSTLHRSQSVPQLTAKYMATPPLRSSVYSRLLGIRAIGRPDPSEVMAPVPPRRPLTRTRTASARSTSVSVRASMRRPSAPERVPVSASLEIRVDFGCVSPTTASDTSPTMFQDDSGATYPLFQKEPIEPSVLARRTSLLSRLLAHTDTVAAAESI